MLYAGQTQESYEMNIVCLHECKELMGTVHPKYASYAKNCGVCACRLGAFDEAARHFNAAISCLWDSCIPHQMPVLLSMVDGCVSQFMQFRRSIHAASLIRRGGDACKLAVSHGSQSSLQQQGRYYGKAMQMYVCEHAYDLALESWKLSIEGFVGHESLQ